MNISKEDRELIRKFEQIMNKGHYVQSQQLTDAYNRILDKHVHNTTCGSCLRQRTKELIDALNNVERREAREQEAAKKAIEESKEQEVDNLPEEEKEANTEQINEVQSDISDELAIEKKEEPKDEPVTQRTTKKGKTSKSKAN